MSFRILFADDSMTAQNMGKKILTDAGYDVVAVSNGAAAVKKIAEQKPDIIILDVYMPGYNGLEVCEKVRASIDTLKTPVLLTVGKMEPYRAEDANRVRADGVIIKPFEASDLLAIVKKLEERIVPKTVAIAEQTVLMERPPDFAPPEHVEAHPEPAQSGPQAIVDVPDHMATAAAFSDLLGGDPTHSFGPPAPPHYTPQAEMQIAPPAIEEEEPSPAIPEFSHTPEPAVEPAPPVAVAENTPQAVEEVSPAPPVYAIHDTQPIPVYQEPEPAIIATEMVVDVTPSVEVPIPEVHIHGQQPSEFPPLVAEPVEVSSHDPLQDSAESSTPAEAVNFEQFTPITGPESLSVAAVAAQNASSDFTAPVSPVSPQITAAPEEPTVAAPAAPEDDFEARVAAAMSIYDETVEEKPVAEPFVAEQPKQEARNGEIPLVAEPVPFHEAEVPPSFATEYQAVAVTSAPEPPLEYQDAYSALKHETTGITAQTPVVEPAPAEVPPAAVEIVHEEVVPAVAEAPVVTEVPVIAEVPAATAETIAGQVEAEFPAAAAAVASATGSDTQVIARVVHRVMERMMPELIEEISRELKSGK